MEKRNILIVKFAYEQIGGIDRQILRISKLLNKSKEYRVSLVTSDLESPLADKFSEIGNVFEVDFNNMSILKSGKKLSKLIKDNGIDIVQSHLFRESIICRVACFYNKNVKHLFRAQTYIDCSWNPKWKNIIYHILDKITSNYVDRFVANGPEVEKEIIEKSFISKSKVTNIINGCVEIGSPDSIENQITINCIAMVANLFPKKGHDTLIKGLSILKEQGFKINVRLIGGEINNIGIRPFKNDITELANQYGVTDQLEFYGFTDDIPNALKGISIVVLPSDSEGVPNCLLEAMSLRKLVVASNVGAVYELIDNDIDGFTHDACDPEAFALALKKAITLNEKEFNGIRQNAYLKWKNQFTLNKMVDKLKAEYSQL